MNLYITPDEIKDLIPDGIRATTTKYDDGLYRLSGAISRLVDQYCNRIFFPRLEARYFCGNGKDRMWVPDLISITSIEFSYDDGSTFETLTADDDYYGAVSDSFIEPEAFNQIILNVNGDYGHFPVGQRSVRITGVWGFADDRDDCWEDSLMTLSAEMSASGTSFSVSTVAVDDVWGTGQALVRGRLVKVGTEFMEVISVASGTVTVKRAMNGSTAAIHASASVIYLWRPPEAVKQATLIQVVRQLERAQQGFGDARASESTGQLFFMKPIDPEAMALLSGYRVMPL